MAESTTKKQKDSKKRANKLTTAGINKEIENLKKMFVEITNEDKKTLIFSLIEEAAFLKMACYQAKEELKTEGITTETINASQRFIKAHPSAAVYEKYSKQYTQIINLLIGYLPPGEEPEENDPLIVLRNS